MALHAVPPPIDSCIPVINKSSRYNMEDKMEDKLESLVKLFQTVVEMQHYMKKKERKNS